MSQHIDHDSPGFYDLDLTTMSQHIGQRISTIFTTKLFYDPTAIDALTEAIDSRAIKNS